METKDIPDKLEAVLARLCETAGPLVKTKAVKLPYLVDVVAQHVLGRRITEGSHQTWDYGVVTREVYRLITHGRNNPLFRIRPHQFSESGQQIELSGPNPTRLSDDEREVVDFVADTYAGLDAGRLGTLTKSLNTHLDLEAWGSNQEAAVDEDAYARLSESWQRLYAQASDLDFADRAQWLETVDDPGEFVRKTLRA